MTEFPKERFNEENAAMAFRALAAHQNFDIVRWAILSRYAAIRESLLPATDGCALNRAAGKLQELEWVLEQFGEPLYGGLPLADGTSDDEIVQAGSAAGAEIGGGYPGGSGSRPPL